MITSTQRMYAVQVNNQGVRYLESYMFEEAIECFRHSLAEYTSAIQAVLGVESTKIPSSNERLQTEFLWANNPFQSKLGNQERGRPVLSLDEGETFIYRRGLLMIPNLATEGISEDVSRATYATEATAVVYNMGLCYHLLSVVRLNSKFLEKAMKFYGIAANMREQSAREIDMIDIGVLNNMGEIHMQLSNFSTARACFDRLVEGLLHFGSLNHLDCIVSQSDQDGFILNATMKSPTTAAAA